MLGLLLAATILAAGTATPTDGKTLVFQDEFNRYRDNVWSTRSTEKTACAEGDAACVRIKDNTLILGVREDPNQPGHYLAGHIGTQGRREFNAYGYFEAKVRFPDIPGVLCGWWLAPSEDYIVGQSEVDVVENYGRRATHHTVWWREAGMLANQFATPAHLVTDLGYRDAQADVHRYGVLWEPSGYTFFIDGQPVGSLAAGLSDRPKYLVLSIKIPDYLVKRGTFDPDSIADYRMRVKWVRVWQ